ncbi:transposase [Pseudoalteromonas sp. S3431]|uniref:transposase n=1 Tax=Pseudoalteromonas sp. S3431 TaxID=579537 RepID=UPI0004A13AE2|nr:transposase [Pseudoalteromonas sp. S3431]KDC52735.1 hypothetical protein DO88_14365 [Pseudoalteromonas sp. S3431]
MRNKYPQEFKDEAVRQIIIMATQFKGVTNRLGITDKLLYSWLTRLIKHPGKIKKGQNLSEKSKGTLHKVTPLQIEGYLHVFCIKYSQ